MDGAKAITSYYPKFDELVKDGTYVIASKASYYRSEKLASGLMDTGIPGDVKYDVVDSVIFHMISTTLSDCLYSDHPFLDRYDTILYFGNPSPDRVIRNVIASFKSTHIGPIKKIIYSENYAHSASVLSYQTPNGIRPNLDGDVVATRRHLIELAKMKEVLPLINVQHENASRTFFIFSPRSMYPGPIQIPYRITFVSRFDRSPTPANEEDLIENPPGHYVLHFTCQYLDKNITPIPKN
jgi:hypothetical protein